MAEMKKKHWMIFRIVFYFIGLFMLLADWDMMYGETFVKFLGSIVLGISIFVDDVND